MKFAYGVSDFRKIVTEGRFYKDRTDKIALIEEHGEYLLFLRPRRFGKSLLLSMLANYYDIAKKEEFEKNFGHLKIGKNPTPLHNKFFILRWDFSCVDPTGNAEQIKRALHDHINERIKRFISDYDDHFDYANIGIDKENAISSIESLITAINKTGHLIYLMIDEYDNFANQVMMGIRRKENIYEALVFEEGPLRTLFKAIKSSTTDSVFDRIFIVGVSPVVMSDITSGYNIGKNIYLEPEFNDLCGFTENEIEDTIEKIGEKCKIEEEGRRKTLAMMRSYYNGYKFSHSAEDHVYNPTLAIYFLDAFQRHCKAPDNMLDSNLATDDAKLVYISQMPKGTRLLLDIVEKGSHNIEELLADRFGINDMLNDQTRDKAFMASFLYYFGVLTIGGKTEIGESILKVPNSVIKRLYAEKIKMMLLPDPSVRDDGKDAAKIFYAKGDIDQLCEFVEKRYFKVFNNRDYRWGNELTVKTAFLTLLYNDMLYMMDSEHEAFGGYSDLTMIIRHDMRKYKIFDILLEFKYVKLKDVNMTREEAQALSKEELAAIPAMREKMNKAKEQLKKYGDELAEKHRNLRLIRFAVVSLGFERIWAEEFDAVYC